MDMTVYENLARALNDLPNGFPPMRSAMTLSCCSTSSAKKKPHWLPDSCRPMRLPRKLQNGIKADYKETRRLLKTLLKNA